MEHVFYTTVKFAVAGYILSTLWLFIVRDKLFGLWNRIPVRAPKPKIRNSPPASAVTPPVNVTDVRADEQKGQKQKSYGEVYLERLAPMPRKHTYISLKMYNDLEGLLPVIARGVSIPNFLENLLIHHFETHRDEINELVREAYSKTILT